MATKAAGRADNRGRLLAAAAQLISREGPRAVSLNDIARGAGLTTGAVYSIFGGQHELLTALLLERAGGPDLAALDPGEGGLEGALRRWARGFASLVLAEPWLWVMELDLLAGAFPGRRGRDELAARSRAMRGQMAARLAAHGLSAPAAERLAAVLYGTLRGLALQGALEPETVTPELFEAAAAATAGCL